jgi:hypothetical protein
MRADNPKHVMRVRLPEELEILKTEFSYQFVDYMQNRMLMSHSRYGKVEDAMVPREDGGPQRIIDALDSAHLRMLKYIETGNTEWLVDAANLVMMEFMYPQHKNAHFRATDSGESPGRVEASSGEAVPYANRDLL